jgi:hypothetical protein
VIVVQQYGNIVGVSVIVPEAAEIAYAVDWGGTGVPNPGEYTSWAVIDPLYGAQPPLEPQVTLTDPVGWTVATSGWTFRCGHGVAVGVKVAVGGFGVAVGVDVGAIVGVNVGPMVGVNVGGAVEVTVGVGDGATTTKFVVQRVPWTKK